jgi:hypothetical protein
MSGIRTALVGGFIAALVMGSVSLLVGRVSGVEAENLLEATIPTTRFLCSGVMTASATILALMLTLLGISSGTEKSLVQEHYRRIRQIAVTVVIAFIYATVVLVAMVIPFGEDLDIPSGWYVAIYYAVTGSSALLGGLLVAVMFMLYAAIRDLIEVFSTGKDSRLVKDEHGSPAGQ